ncbi:MAG: energy-coupling factor transporter transmembrane component T family protein [Chloroflexia bacterium]
MSDFEVLRTLSFGQYLPTGSALHRLDPRVRLTGVALFILALMACAHPTTALLGLGLALGLLVAARIPPRYALRGLRPLLPLFAFVLVLQVLFYPHAAAVAAGSRVVWREGPFLVSTAGLLDTAAILLRMVAIVLFLILLAGIADTTDLVHAVEGMLRPFRRLGLPAHELALVLAITMRFIPLLGRELERLMKAQAARGADFGRGRGWTRLHRLLPLLVPLFVAALRRAEELALAMEARGYVGGRGRTYLVRLQMRPADFLALALALAFAALLVFWDRGGVTYALTFRI